MIPYRCYVGHVRRVGLAALKLAILSGAVWLVITVALTAIAASAPSAEEVCARAKPGMTVRQIEDATPFFEGLYLLRDDGILVISARPHSSGAAVCRVVIDPASARALSKSVGPIEAKDWPAF